MRTKKGLPTNTVGRKAFRIIQVASAGQRLLPGVIRYIAHGVPDFDSVDRFCCKLLINSLYDNF